MKLNLWIYLCLCLLIAAPMTVIGCGGSDDDDSAGDDDDTTGDDDDTTGDDDDTSVTDDDDSATSDDDDDDSATSGDDDDSATSGDDDDSATWGDDDDSAAASAPNCADYCADRVADCGDDATYCGMACGAAVTAGLPLGTTGDASGNTLGCRQYHTDVAAATSDTAHCGHGNLFGGTTTDGFPCTDSLVQAYCGLMLANCSIADGGYADYAACWAAGAAVPSVGAPAGGAAWPAAGDSIECRIYHAEVAGLPASVTADHCGHAAGGAPCQ